MQAKKILFPTDFSTLSDAALKYATTLAKDMGAKLVIVHIEEPPAAYGAGEMYYGIPDPDTAALRKMLEAVKPTDRLPCPMSTGWSRANRAQRSSSWPRKRMPT